MGDGGGLVLGFQAAGVLIGPGRKQQIYAISPTGGAAIQLTAVETGVSAFRWSPEESKIAYVSSGPETKVRKDRKERYGDFES